MISKLSYQPLKLFSGRCRKWPLLLTALFLSALTDAQTVNYSPLFTDATFKKEIDLSLPVGVVEGQHGVSPNGSATYTMPIKVAPGSNSLVPSLSLIYNAQGANGIAGYGWNIGGISSIERTFATKYYDNVVGPLPDNGYDNINREQLTLDGERLIRVSFNNENVMQIATQPILDVSALVFSFANSRGIYVKAVGNYPNDYSYQYVDKNGTKYEYGATINSRVQLDNGQNILRWYISRITDVNGFYVDYKYTNVNGEILIDEILYTGNSKQNVAPYNKVKFYYAERSDKNILYCEGKAIKQYQLLQKIEVTAEGSLVNAYNLNYGKDNNEISGNYSFLNEVTMFGSDNSHLNSTIFKYGNPVTEYQSKPASIILNGEDRVVGDFNGDGISDIGLIDPSAGSSGTISYKFYKGNVSGQNLQILGTLTLPAQQHITQKLVFGLYKFQTPLSIMGHFSSDFDGDGNDDVLTTVYEQAGSDLYLRKLRLIRYSGGSFNNSDILLPPNNNYGYIVKTQKYPVTLGDFNGDKWPDVLVTVLDKQDNNYKAFISYDIGRNTSPTFVQLDNSSNDYSSFKDNLLQADKLFVIDHNGDGKNEILTVMGNDSRIYSLSETSNNHFNVIYSSNSYPTTNYDINIGDFNGDGKTDLLTRQRNNSLWQIAYSDGHENYDVQLFNGTGSLIGDYYEENRAYNYATGPFPEMRYYPDKIILGDFNGDAKTDIIHAVTYTEGGSVRDPFTHRQRLNTYFSKGNNSFANKIYNYDSWLSTCENCLLANDLNGDGKTDIFTGTEQQPPNSGSYSNIISFAPDGQEKYLQKIINGYNVQTEFSYDFMTKSSNYTCTNAGIVNKDNPSTTFPSLLVTSSKVKALNGTGIQMENTSYKYENAIVNKSGLGFLGFKKMMTTDNIQQKSVISEMEFLINPENAPSNTVVSPYVSNTRTYAVTSNQLLASSFSRIKVNQSGKVTFLVQNSDSTTNDLAGTFSSNKSYFDNAVNTIRTEININNLENTSTDFAYVAFGEMVKPNTITINKIRQGSTLITEKSRLEYFSNGKLSKKTEFDGLPNKIEHLYGYNNLGLLSSETVSGIGVPSSSVNTEYDVKGRFIINNTNETGRSESFTYDPRSGAVLTHTGYDKNTTTYEHDAYFNLVKTNYPEGYYSSDTKQWFLDGVNLVRVSKFIQGGASEMNDIDAAGRVTKSYKLFQDLPWNWFGTTVMFPTPSEASIRYDLKGNKIYDEQPHISGATNFIANNYSYDYLNRLVSVCNQYGCTTSAYSYAGGNSKVSITLPSGQVKEKINDAANRVISSTDDGGTVSMDYDSWGNVTNTKLGTAIISTATYDNYNRKVSFMEKNAGTSTYEYDGSGRLNKEINPNGNTHSYEYDILNRIVKRTGPEGITSYLYKNANNRGEAFQIEKVIDFNNDYKSYDYNNLGFVTHMRETVRGIAYDYEYTYDQFGKRISTIYPTGTLINNVYNNYGVWTTVKMGNKVLYDRTSMDGLGRTLKANAGNGLTTTSTYYYDFLTRMQSPVMDYNLEYDYSTGNVIRRADLVKNNEDIFSYDELNRLTNTTTGQINGLQLSPMTMTYDRLSGNIKSKGDIGTYNYGVKPNAVTYVSNTQGIIPANVQDIKYSSFLKPESITENGWNETFLYNHDYDRVESKIYNNNVLSETRNYLPEGIEIHTKGNTPQQIQYIPGPDGLCAVYLMVGNTSGLSYSTLYYPYTDHLGSILKLTNEQGAIVYEQSFDSWGRYRNPSTWAYISIPSNAGFEWLHGFTGHEHLPQFGLINMNARLYDPLLGRMLSPDAYVSDPMGTQAYNRYTYANNNPLKYIDPDGNNPAVVLAWTAVASGAFIGISSSVASVYGSPGGMKNWDWAGFAGSAVTGAAGGGMTFGVGNAFMSTAGLSSFGNEALRGLMHGYVSLVQSGDLTSAAAGIAGSYATSAGTAGMPKLLGSFGGGLVVSGAFGGFGALATGGKFWQGAVIGIEGYLLNQVMHKSTVKRPDNDGVITLDEAKYWWKNGKGEPLYADFNKLDLKAVYSDEFTSENEKYINLFFRDSESGNVYGTIKIRYVGNNKVESAIGYDIYDFNMDGRALRDFATKIGAWYHGAGTPYRIYFKGRATISPSSIYGKENNTTK